MTSEIFDKRYQSGDYEGRVLAEVAAQKPVRLALQPNQVKYCCNSQWEIEIRSSLDIELSKRGWVTNGPDFEWDLKSGSQPFKIWTKRRHFVKNYLKSGQKCPNFE